MTARNKKTGEDFEIKTPWGTISFRAFLLICIASMTPAGQWGLQRLGYQTPVADLEAIKVDVESLKKEAAATRVEAAGIKIQTAKTDEKINALLVEFEAFRVEQKRTAINR